MKKKGSVFVVWFATFLLCAASVHHAAGFEEADLSTRLAETVGALSSLPSRIAGYHGSDVAAAYVEAMLSDTGVKNVRAEEFPVVVPVDKGASLEIDGVDRPFTLYPMWPNFTRTPKLPPQGLEGRLVYCGRGYPWEFDGRDMTDAIALMEFDCAQRWLTAALWGAKAIIFIEPELAGRPEAEVKFLSVPAPLHRYWLPRAELAALLASRSAPPGPDQWREAVLAIGAPESDAMNVRIRADMVWEERLTRNIFGLIPGTDPALSRETIIIESFYDSMSVVPALAPGAEAACGIAGLLEIARDLVAHPPARSIVIMAAGGHFAGLSGARHFVQSHHYRDLLETRKQGPSGEPPVMFLGLDLSSGTDQLGLFGRGFFYEQRLDINDVNSINRRFEGVSKRFAAYMKELSEAGSQDLATKYADSATPVKGISWRAFTPAPLGFDGEAFTLAGKDGMTLATVYDPRSLVDTPHDTFDRVNIGNLVTQVRLAGEIVRRAANDPELAFGRRREEERFANCFGKVIRDQLVGGYVPMKPEPGVMVGATISAFARPTVTGVRGTVFTFSNPKGLFELYGLHVGSLYYIRPPAVPITAVRFDPSTGAITHCVNTAGKGFNGSVQARTIARAPAWEDRETDVRIPIFECVSTTILDMFDQRQLSTPFAIDAPGEAQPLDAEGNSELIRRRVFMGRVDRGWNKSGNQSRSEPVAVFFTEKETPIKIMVYGSGGTKVLPRIALLNASATVHEGSGFAPDKPENIIDQTTLRAVSDLWYLNDARIKEMLRYGVANARVNKLHSLAGEKLKAAEAELASKNYSKGLELARSAWALESTAYPAVRNTADDVVKGIIFYFALLLPFVIFMERLMFTFADIRKQLVATGAIFMAVYLILERVHPAFRLSQAPLLVLLAFFIMATGGIVIVYLLSKFGEQMEKLRARSAMIHRSDVGRLSSAAAAFALGVSNMKKRKVRTALTCLTLTVLGFTVISFVSFTSLTAINRRRTGDTPPAYQGFLVRSQDWLALESYAVDSIANTFRNIAKAIVARSWLMASDNKIMSIRLGNELDYSKRFDASAVLGLDEAESELIKPGKALLYGQWFGSSPAAGSGAETAECIITAQMAEALGVTEENYTRARITLFDKKLRVAGVVDAAIWGKLTDLDNEPLTPVDYDAMEEILAQLAARGPQKVGQDTGLEIPIPQKYEHLEPAGVVIVPRALAESFGAVIKSVAVAFPSPEETDTALKKYVPEVGLLLFAGVGEGTYLYSSRGGLSVKGLADLMIPIAIAALIVFNTMLGAVYERAREIRIYSSVGLAPTHIAALFMAESAVYATIGAIFGYLLGQIAGKVITMQNLLPGLVLNYSSFSAVAATMVVMAVVLLSTIWPARVAAKCSVADEAKIIKLTKPEGDDWRFPFPFTVSRAEGLGVNVFMKQYFDDNDEYSGVRFCASDTSILRFDAQEGASYALESLVWVAPFDMGISQRVRLETVPDPTDERVYKIRFHLHREAGELTAWENMNLGFIKEIRKQFLIWRIVSSDHKKQLDKLGREMLAPQGSESVVGTV